MARLIYPQLILKQTFCAMKRSPLIRSCMNQVRHRLRPKEIFEIVNYLFMRSLYNKLNIVSPKVHVG